MNFIKLIQQIEKRPGMYISRTDDLKELELMFYGYGFGVSINNLDDLESFNCEFNEFLYKIHSLSCSSGWAKALKDNINNGEN